MSQKFYCNACNKNFEEYDVEKLHAGAVVVGYGCPECKGPVFSDSNENQNKKPQDIPGEIIQPNKKTQTEIVQEETNRQMNEIKKKTKLSFLKAGIRDLVIGIIIIGILLKISGIPTSKDFPQILGFLTGIFFSIRGIRRFFMYF